MLIGSHVPPDDPLGSAAAEGADCVQIFLGNPQSWKAPKPRDDAAELKKSKVPVYVHAPYLINVASANISRRRFEEALTGEFQISRARTALASKGPMGTTKAIARKVQGRVRRAMSR